MSRLISRAESWQTVYTAFQNINFAAFDYETIKQSMIDYVKLYFPENFNDYIESSEFIAIVELFAYLGEILAYRFDVAAHENFLSTAQRKQSVLRLAKLISYNPSRNIPARGLVKITSVTTSEQVVDSNGTNLANTRITWNDPNNANWKEQFFLVINRLLEQEFGTVLPKDRVQVDNVLFELYSLKNNSTTNGVIPYSASVSGKSYSMELVPSSLNEFGPYEKRPELNSKFSILYGSDGLGDASDTTGFFAFTKQGTLQQITLSFDGITPNQAEDLTATNINETDVWVNNVDQVTGEILDDGTTTDQRSGEWNLVDIAHAQNIVFNTNTNRNKYEIETLEDDKVRLIFGDGEFANIPSGTFHVWIRTSANENVVIPQNAAVGNRASFKYQDANNISQTFTFTYSLVNTLQNSSVSEDIDHIRKLAPAVYYTQDRMVNARDYNTFMLQDPTILKLRAINRTYAGDSKYLTWNDPKEAYQDVKLFGDDLAIYYKFTPVSFTVPGITGTTLLTDYIEPLLSSTDVFLKLSVLDPHDTRRKFTGVEETAISAILDPQLPNPPLGVGNVVYLYHDDFGSGQWWNATLTNLSADPRTVFTAVIDVNGIWTVTYNTVRIIIESPTTKFWHTNDGSRAISFDTLTSVGDQITVLKANENRDRDGILSANIKFDILSQELDDSGLQNIHQLRVLPEDINEDNIPDDVELNQLINPTVTITAPGVVTLPIYYVVGANDVTVVGTDVAEVTNVTTVADINGNLSGTYFTLNSPTTAYYAWYNVTPRVEITNIDFTAHTIVAGDYWLITAPSGAFYVWYTVDAAGADPAPGGTGILVAILSTDTPSQVATKTAAAISLNANFGAIAVTTVVTVTNTTAGSVTDAADFNAGVAVTVTQQGINTSVDPAPGGTGIQININGDDSANDVASKTNTVIALHVDFASTVLNNVVTITNAAVGSATNATVGTSGFAVAVITQGEGITPFVISVDWTEVGSAGDASNTINVSTLNGYTSVVITVKEYVYFYRATILDEWELVTITPTVIESYVSDLTNTTEATRLYRRENGRGSLNFMWAHIARSYNLIDPSVTNIIDMFIITRGYYTNVRNWLDGVITDEPADPTPLQLRVDYAELLNNKMISDTVVLHPGQFKILFGDKAIPQLQAKIKVIRSTNQSLTDNQIKVKVVTAIKNFFDVSMWEFGESFYFTELAAAIHNALPVNINSVILVPIVTDNYFGDLFQVDAREDEIFIPDVSIEDIEIVETLNPIVLKQVNA